MGMRLGGGFYYRTIANYNFGMITTKQREETPVGSFMDAVNVNLSSNGIFRRYGQTSLDNPEVPASINGLYQYSRQYNPVGGGIDIYRCYIFSAGDRLYLWDGEGDDTVWDVTEALEATLSSDDIYACIYFDFMYITNGHEIIKTDATNSGTRLLSRLASLLPIPLPPGVALGGIGSLKGHRSYKLRYVKASGEVVSAASEFTSAVESPNANNQCFIVSYVQSPNPDVTHIEAWATPTYTVAGSPPETYYLLRTVPNATSAFVDNIDDTTLQAGYTEDTTNQSIGRLNGLNKLIVYKDRLYGICEGIDPSIVWYSELGNPDLWLDNSWIDFNRDDGDIITIMAVRGNTLYVFKQYGIYSMTGDPAANPLIQHELSAHSSNQTSCGLGCTSPRSLVTYRGDIIFYSKYHGVWSIGSDGVKPLSNNILDRITGLENAAGGIYIDPNTSVPYYVLSTESEAWRCNLQTGAWVRDTNVNVRCFCVDHRGYLLGGKGGIINRYYNPDAETDNGSIINMKVRTNWITLQEGHLVGVPRKLILSGNGLSDKVMISLYNELSDQPYSVFITGADEAEIDLLGEPSRLCSYAISWQHGIIENMVLEFLRKPLR